MVGGWGPEALHTNVEFRGFHLMWQLPARRLAANPGSPRRGLAHRTSWGCSVRIARYFPPLERSYLRASVHVTTPAASCRARAASCCAGALPLRSRRVATPVPLGSHATPLRDGLVSGSHAVHLNSSLTYSSRARNQESRRFPSLPGPKTSYGLSLPSLACSTDTRSPRWIFAAVAAWWRGRRC